MTRRHLAAVLWRYGRTARWVLAGLCLLLAIGSALSSADPPPAVMLTVANHDVAAGATLTSADLTTTRSNLPLDTPGVAELDGQIVNGPLAAGEPVTRSRLVPGRLVPAAAGSVVFPLRLDDLRVARLLHAGDRVDVLVTPDALSPGDPQVLAGDVEVLGVPQSDDGSFAAASPQSGAVVLLAVAPDQAQTLAGIRTGDAVSVAIRTDR